MLTARAFFWPGFTDDMPLVGQVDVYVFHCGLRWVGFLSLYGAHINRDFVGKSRAINSMTFYSYLSWVGATWLLVWAFGAVVSQFVWILVSHLLHGSCLPPWRDFFFPALRGVSTSRASTLRLYGRLFPSRLDWLTFYFNCRQLSHLSGHVPSLLYILADNLVKDYP